MRVLLDENLPVDLAGELKGHDVSTVRGLGWQGVANGELLRRASGRFDCLLTLDRNIEFQQDIGALPMGIVLMRSKSSRMTHLRPLVPSLLAELEKVRAGQLVRVG